jgi:general secretion pathway protein F
MPQFRYKAVTSAGEEVEGALEAASRAAAIDRLRREGHTPIRADEISGLPGLGRLSKPWRISRQLSQADIILLTRELATLLQAGLPLDRALTVASELSPEGAQRRFLQAILNAVRGGATLADAMTAPGVTLPAFYVGMVRAGEAGGTLDAVLARLADTLERTQALRESIRSALYYPIIVVVVAILTLVLLLTAVVPEFRPLFDDAGTAMPMPMMILLEAGDFLKRWWWALLLLLVGIVFGARHYKSRPQGRLQWDGWLSRTPLIGDLVVKIEVARFARTFGTLLANGVTTLQAFSIAIGAIGNRAIAQGIDNVTSQLKRGEGLATPLRETGMFPRLAAQLVQVGEESGQLEAMLLRVADIYDEEVKRTLQRLLALLTPVVTIGLGILVAGIVGSMLSAILSTYEVQF